MEEGGAGSGANDGGGIASLHAADGGGHPSPPEHSRSPQNGNGGGFQPTIDHRGACVGVEWRGGGGGVGASGARLAAAASPSPCFVRDVVSKKFECVEFCVKIAFQRDRPRVNFTGARR